ncbi:MAG: hypothetical protein B6241_13280 [Spirochaetaceae bacterium 4572_59]|nr:MAG: hypothetical protein B6241_13280 [Spirochaetaceae bacterium 4572_59]
MTPQCEKGKNRKRIELGRKGEDIAQEYLEDRGYELVGRNERVGHSDIDILARDKEILVFVEVRTRSVEDRGMPEETLNAKKLKRMRKTAEIYMALHRYEGAARLDAVCLILEEGDKVSHFKHYSSVGVDP